MSHEGEKKTENMPRTIQVENGSLRAAVFGSSGEMSTLPVERLINL